MLDVRGIELLHPLLGIQTQGRWSWQLDCNYPPVRKPLHRTISKNKRFDLGDLFQRISQRQSRKDPISFQCPCQKKCLPVEFNYYKRSEERMCKNQKRLRNVEHHNKVQLSKPCYCTSPVLLRRTAQIIDNVGIQCSHGRFEDQRTFHLKEQLINQTWKQIQDIWLSIPLLGHARTLNVMYEANSWHMSHLLGCSWGLIWSAPRQWPQLLTHQILLAGSMLQPKENTKELGWAVDLLGLWVEP